MTTPTMPRHRHRLTAGLLAVIAATAALIAPVNAAAPAWRPPTTISTPSPDVQPSVAVTADGHASMFFHSYVNGEWRLWNSTRTPGSAWKPGTQLAPISTPSNTNAPALTADRTTATAVWAAPVGGDWQVRSARRTGGGAWTPATDIGPTVPSLAEIVVDANPNGDVVAAWTYIVPGHHVLQVARRPRGSTWTQPFEVADLEVPAVADVVSLEINAAGAIVLVWVVLDQGVYRVASAYRPSGGPWGPREFVSATGQSAGDPAVAIDARGNAVATFVRSDGSKNRIQASYRAADGHWGPAATLSESGQDAAWPHVTVDGRGRFSTAWFRSNGSKDVIQASTRATNGSWATPVTLSPADVYAAPTGLVADAAGNVTLVWAQEACVGCLRAVFAARRPPSGPWAPAVPVSAQMPVSGPSGPAVLDARGNVTIAWFENGNDTVHVASLDVVGPLSRVTAPAARFTLGPVAVKWAATDEISAITGYRTRVSSALPAGPFTAPATWLASTTAKTATYTPTIRGRTYCFTARATDAGSHVGAFSPQRCTAVPLDERALTAGGGWTKRTLQAAYRGTVVTATDDGRTLTSDTVQVKRIALIATRAPGAGTVTVYLGNTKLKTISLAAATTRHRQIIPVATFASRRAGTVRIVTTTTKPVAIDGLGISAM